MVNTHTGFSVSHVVDNYCTKKYSYYKVNYTNSQALGHNNKHHSTTTIIIITVIVIIIMPDGFSTHRYGESNNNSVFNT